MCARQMEGLRGPQRALRRAAGTCGIREGSLGRGCSGDLRSRCGGRSLFNCELVCSLLTDATVGM